MSRRSRFPILNTPLGEVTPPILDDWWLSGGVSSADCVLAYAPKGADDFTAARLNLNNVGVLDAITGVAPAWNASTGWSFDGTQYLRTQYSANSVSHTLMVRFANVSASGSDYRIGNSNNYVAPRFSGNQRGYVNGGFNFVAATSNITAGTMAVAGANCYLDGAADGTLTTSLAGSFEYIVGARAAIPDQPLIGDILAYALYSRVLTAGEIAALHTAMMAL